MSVWLLELIASSKMRPFAHEPRALVTFALSSLGVDRCCDRRQICFWNNDILKPIQKYGASEGTHGATAFSKLRVLLDRMMLRRTKLERADDLGLPPRMVEVRRDYLYVSPAPPPRQGESAEATAQHRGGRGALHFALLRRPPPVLQLRRRRHHVRPLISGTSSS